VLSTHYYNLVYKAQACMHMTALPSPELRAVLKVPDHEMG